MAIALDHEHVRDREQLLPTHALAAIGSLGWLGLAGAASLAAGAIHAAAIGVHSEHHQAVITFTVVAAIQLGFGAVALTRPGRLVLALGMLANAGLVVGWQMAKTSGISFIDGLEVAEPRQFTDMAAAALAAVAALAVVIHVLRPRTLALSRSPLLTGTAAVAIAALAVPGMINAGTHVHAHDEVAGAAHDHGDAAAGDTPVETASAVPAKPYDPSLPLDFGGVEGVTPQQQARAENLVAITLARLPQFADPAVAESMGFVSIGDGFLGHEHYLNAANMRDDKILDPDFPESLVYDTTVTPKKLVSAMFMMNPGDTLADVPDVGGALTQWHVHNNLCFAGPRVAGLTDAAGNCPTGLTKGAETPMIHVWIDASPGTIPYDCGPFSALEGVGAGTVAEGETRLCDHAHAH
jgi:hypothetical protein